MVRQPYQKLARRKRSVPEVKNLLGALDHIIGWLFGNIYDPLSPGENNHDNCRSRYQRLYPLPPDFKNIKLHGLTAVVSLYFKLRFSGTTVNCSAGCAN